MGYAMRVRPSLPRGLYPLLPPVQGTDLQHTDEIYFKEEIGIRHEMEQQHLLSS